jgi:hypothetical protein
MTQSRRVFHVLMTDLPLLKNLNALTRAATLLCGEQLHLPALALVYTGLDVIASIERKLDEGTKAAFIRWVNAYFIPRLPVPCTGEDIYGARCGILHALTARSDLSAQGKAREIVYACGQAKKGVLEEVARRRKTDWIVLHVSEIIQAFEKSMASYVEDLAASRDATRLKRAEKALRLWFTYIPLEQPESTC